jgi:pseudouridylate synthase / pseudouridine kinase
MICECSESPRGLSHLLTHLRAGIAALASLEKEGLDATGVSVFANSAVKDPSLHKTSAQYVSVNDSKKDLVLAMADMSIFNTESRHTTLIYKWRMAILGTPKWVVVDANWHPLRIRYLMSRSKGLPSKFLTKTAYEPVSVPKSAGLFQKPGSGYDISLPTFPLHSVDLSTPNQHELAAMHASAKEHGYFESAEWWQIIDALGIPSTGARDRFLALTNNKLTDDGIPLQTIQLLPLIPTILTKLGAEGVLMTELLKPDDPRLMDSASTPYILSRNASESPVVGGVYMRLFPAVEKVEDAVSVNGVGDTFLGVIVAGLARGMKLDEKLIDIAQRGAVMTLRSKEAVSPELGVLSDELGEPGLRDSASSAPSLREISERGVEGEGVSCGAWALEGVLVNQLY